MHPQAQLPRSAALWLVEHLSNVAASVLAFSDGGDIMGYKTINGALNGDTVQYQSTISWAFNMF
jgi:hypothetical protein